MRCEPHSKWKDPAWPSLGEVRAFANNLSELRAELEVAVEIAEREVLSLAVTEAERLYSFMVQRCAQNIAGTTGMPPWVGKRPTQ